jgi:hypothetical protein
VRQASPQIRVIGALWSDKAPPDMFHDGVEKRGLLFLFFLLGLLTGFFNQRHAALGN